MENPDLANAEYWAWFWEKVGTVAFFVLVLSIAAEFIAERLAAPHKEKLEHAREERIAAANERAAKAELALVEYRKSRSDRVAAAATDVAEKLTPFAGTKFDFGHGPEGFREQWDFAWRFEPVLIKAGWSFTDWLGGTMIAKLNDWSSGRRIYGITNVVNVSLEMHTDDEAALSPAARALADALNAAGIAASAGGNNNTSANRGVIHILIGEKQ